MQWPQNHTIVLPARDGKPGFSMVSLRPIEILTIAERERITTILDRIQNALYQIQFYMIRESFLSTKSHMVDLSVNKLQQLRAYIYESKVASRISVKCLLEYLQTLGITICENVYLNNILHAEHLPMSNTSGKFQQLVSNQPSTMLNQRKEVQTNSLPRVTTTYSIQQQHQRQQQLQRPQSQQKHNQQPQQQPQRQPQLPLPQQHLPQPQLSQPHLPQPQLPQPQLPQPHLPRPQLPQPQLPQQKHNQQQQSENLPDISKVKIKTEPGLEDRAEEEEIRKTTSCSSFSEYFQNVEKFVDQYVDEHFETLVASSPPKKKNNYEGKTPLRTDEIEEPISQPIVDQGARVMLEDILKCPIINFSQQSNINVNMIEATKDEDSNNNHQSFSSLKLTSPRATSLENDQHQINHIEIDHSSKENVVVRSPMLKLSKPEKTRFRYSDKMDNSKKAKLSSDLEDVLKEKEKGVHLVISTEQPPSKNTKQILLASLARSKLANNNLPEATEKCSVKAENIGGGMKQKLPNKVRYMARRTASSCVTEKHRNVIKIEEMRSSDNQHVEIVSEPLKGKHACPASSDKKLPALLCQKVAIKNIMSSEPKSFIEKSFINSKRKLPFLDENQNGKVEKKKKVETIKQKHSDKQRPVKDLTWPKSKDCAVKTNVQSAHKKVTSRQGEAERMALASSLLLKRQKVMIRKQKKKIIKKRAVSQEDIFKIHSLSSKAVEVSKTTSIRDNKEMLKESTPFIEYYKLGSKHNPRATPKKKIPSPKKQKDLKANICSSNHHNNLLRKPHPAAVKSAPRSAGKNKSLPTIHLHNRIVSEVVTKLGSKAIIGASESQTISSRVEGLPSKQSSTIKTTPTPQKENNFDKNLFNVIEKFYEK